MQTQYTAPGANYLIRATVWQHDVRDKCGTRSWDAPGGCTGYWLAKGNTNYITAYQLSSALMHDTVALVTYLPCIIPLGKTQQCHENVALTLHNSIHAPRSCDVPASIDTNK